MNTGLVRLLMLSLVLRCIAAATLELGNDEVYYMTYARYPAWSHFDHPPMVGWLIQLFSLNLTYTSEWILRLPSIVLGSINLILIYSITKQIANERAAYISALLAFSSTFVSIISGVFILPDTPLTFFWLLAILFFIRSLDPKTSHAKLNLILAGLFTGLAMLSKYHAVYLWIGFGLYILLRKRELLSRIELYVSILFSFAFVLPILYWNYQNDFISFSFHSDRVSFFAGGINFNTFIQELLGSIFYNNLIISFIIWIILIKGKKALSQSQDTIFLLKLLALPLIITTLFISLWRQTLPHWSAPAYTGLIPLAGIYLSQHKFASILTKSAMTLTIVVLVLGTAQIRFGVLPLFSYEDDPIRKGKKDFTLDMYGWEMAKSQIDSCLRTTGLSNSDILFISHNWFPSAHFDHYIARPLGIPLLAAGDLHAVHKFAWINSIRNPAQKPSQIFYLTDSRNYKEPREALGPASVVSLPPIILPIKRNNEVVKNIFLFKVENLSMETIAQLDSR
jgi:hypothetical protein